jgi:hypothetical protein
MKQTPNLQMKQNYEKKLSDWFSPGGSSSSVPVGTTESISEPADHGS